MPGLDGDALVFTRAHMAALAARLHEARRDPGSWSGLAHDVEQRGGAWRDRNQPARAAVVAALARDLQDGDRALLRFVLEQEVLRAAADPFQGIGDALHTAAALVARARDPGDLLLLARAKAANFDTACGLDVELLWSAGHDAALAALAALPADEQAWVRAFMHDADGEPPDDGDAAITPCVSPDDLARWWAHHEAGWARRWQDEPPLAFLELARASGDRAWATALIDAEERGLARDRRALESLAYLRRENHQREAELALLREAAALPAAAHDSGSLPSQIVDCLLGLGRAAEAAAASQAAIAAVVAEADWYRYGSGRMLVELCFRVARALPTGPAATAYLREAHTLARTLSARPLVLLEHGEAAARRHQRERLAAWYGRQRRAERRRIDDTLRA
jgi:hypothetical protein